jgi:two-component system phosphate regulon response regulator PhoB
MGVAAPAFVLGDEGQEPPDEPGTGRRHLSSVGDTDAVAPKKRTPCVLLVEDDAAMRIVCQVNLESEGFRVVVADRGAEALRLAASEQPDIVLLDVMLPDLGGFEIAAQLKHLPIVFLSARASQLDIERGRQAGALDYVTKPFDPIALPARVREDLDEFTRSGSAERVWRMRFGPA